MIMLPGLCILCTILPRVLLGDLSCLVSNSAFPHTNFAIVYGFFELMGQDLVLESHATVVLGCH